MTSSQDLEIDELRTALARGDDVLAVHYACESFHTAADHPPGVACIALSDLQADSVVAFSRSDAPLDKLGDDREIALFDRFYGALAGRPEAVLLHWNMNRPEYGFEALSTRYEYLTGRRPGRPVVARRLDVDSLLMSRFGDEYAPHGRLESTARLNGLDMRSFRKGRDEALLFDEGDWGALSRSAASKAKIVGELARRLVQGTIRTMDSAGQLEFARARLDAVPVVLQVGERFRQVQRSMAKHPHGGAVVPFQNEWDDQYVFRALLTLFFDDIREEDPVPTTAGGGSRIDFVLPDHLLAIELKRAGPGLTDAKLGEQLLVDRGRYASRPDVTHLICLVFDPEGAVRNPRALEKDLRQANTSADLTITVRVYD